MELLKSTVTPRNFVKCFGKKGTLVSMTCAVSEIHDAPPKTRTSLRITALVHGSLEGGKREGGWPKRPPCRCRQVSACGPAHSNGNYFHESGLQIMASIKHPSDCPL